MKRCVKCGRRKPEGAYAVTWSRTKNRKVKAVTCGACSDKTREQRKRWRNSSAITRTYGISPPEWAAIKKKARYRCEVCGAEEHTLKRGLVVDHCHDKGHVRGALCDNCNKSLGLLQESPALMRAAAKYIERRA